MVCLSLNQIDVNIRCAEQDAQAAAAAWAPSPSMKPPFAVALTHTVAVLCNLPASELVKLRVGERIELISVL